jgi:hypothetical protein
MQRRLLIGLVALLCAASILAAWPARAEHFDIRLTLRTSKGVAEASWDTSPPEGGLNPRQSVTAAAGEDLALQWELRSEFPHGAMKRTVVRLFAVEEGQIGQRTLPGPDAALLFDNRFTADFLPKHSARGIVRFRALKPGSYLIRLESEGTQKEHDHEHFAALDLKVE